MHVGPERFVDERVEFKLHPGTPPAIKIIADPPPVKQWAIQGDFKEFKLG